MRPTNNLNSFNWGIRIDIPHGVHCDIDQLAACVEILGQMK
jgi:hypothetical protein